jgi:prepilin peptidase CpaA
MNMHSMAWWPILALLAMATSDLVSAFWTKGVHPHPSLVLDNPSARTMPYAPAIAIGTIFSFFAV